MFFFVRSFRSIRKHSVCAHIETDHRGANHIVTICVELSRGKTMQTNATFNIKYQRMRIARPHPCMVRACMRYESMNVGCRCVSVCVVLLCIIAIILHINSLCESFARATIIINHLEIFFRSFARQLNFPHTSESGLLPRRRRANH